MRTIAMLAAMLFAAGILTSSDARAQTASAALPVIELFTSQGCSSCPPADALLKTYAARRDVVALSFNVDYWDYLGWKDTLGKHEFTKRQKAYARARGDGAVYTPQAVVNGTVHVVGSDQASLERALAAGLAEIARQRIVLDIKVSGSTVTVSAGEGMPPAEPATVWIAAVAPAVAVAVQRGENSGSKLSYHNVVRKLTKIGTWTGKAATFTASASEVMPEDTKDCAVIVQRGSVGPVIAAAWMPAMQQTAKP